MTNTLNKSQISALRRAAFADFLFNLEKKLQWQGYGFERSKMPGTKRDMIYLLKNNYQVLETLSEATFEEYMREAGCKFQSGSATKAGNKGFLINIYSINR